MPPFATGREVQVLAVPVIHLFGPQSGLTVTPEVGRIALAQVPGQLSGQKLTRRHDRQLTADDLPFRAAVFRRPRCHMMNRLTRNPDSTQIWR